LNQQKMDELTAGLARALALVDEVKNATYAEPIQAYKYTRRFSNRAVRAIETLLGVLQAEWAADELELDEELSRHEQTKGN
jgi:ribosomal protein L31E